MNEGSQRSAGRTRESDALGHFTDPAIDGLASAAMRNMLITNDPTKAYQMHRRDVSQYL